MDPVTAGIIIAVISGAAKAGSSLLGAAQEKKMAKKRAKEMKRSTYGDILNTALQQGSDIEAQRLESSARKNRRHTQALMNTAAGVRESLNL